MRLVQLIHNGQRHIALVDEPNLVLLNDASSLYDLAQRAIDAGGSLTASVEALRSTERLVYDDVYAGGSDWKLLAPIDVPGDPHKVLVSGTGLTHLGSARDRQAMHATPQDEAAMTDSMRIFEWGRQKGRPAPGEIGIAPEWFYKGDGFAIQPPFAPLHVPAFAEDGGEEGEIAVIYIVASDGTPHRVGMANGNEFSDHVFERRNYLNLAGSKLRTCSLGPELVIAPAFSDVPGTVTVTRNHQTLWHKKIRTGEDNMCHSLANIEHHHFKFPGNRQPGMLHVHYLGADSLSFGEGIRLRDGDTMEVSFEGFGRPLRNTVAVETAEPQLVTVRSLS
ncbi:MAG: AraD1 family protein [Acidobacteriota bacterium]